MSKSIYNNIGDQDIGKSIYFDDIKPSAETISKILQSIDSVIDSSIINFIDNLKISTAEEIELLKFK